MQFARRLTAFKQIPTRGFATVGSKSSFKVSRVLVAGAALAGTAAALNYSVANLSSAECAAESPAAPPKADRFAQTSFYPPIEAYDKGFLKVDDVHTIAYSQYGNPKGKPVLFIHGGPGGGTNPNMARFFDPAAYRIILVDQRGCGDSTPFANLQNNSTYDSVRDFEKLREKLKISKWQLFGGSWGSTLALAYAMEHPHRVTELVLRGVFLIRQKELDWMYEGKGANYVFPEDWEAYESVIPEIERDNFIRAYNRRLMGDMGEEEMIRAAKAWSVWEGRISKLRQDPVESLLETFANPHWATAFARIENHYFINNAWFPRDGYLLEKENIDKIRKIPTVIVQGRYDIVCPAISAHDLHKAMPESEIHYVLTGHSGFETDIIRELVNATNKFKSRK